MCWPRTACRQAQRWINWASARSRFCASSPAAPTTEQIATHLNLSVKTVQNYHYLIKTKTGTRTDAQLVRLAASCGLTKI